MTVVDIPATRSGPWITHDVPAQRVLGMRCMNPLGSGCDVNIEIAILNAEWRNRGTAAGIPGCAFPVKYDENIHQRQGQTI